MDEKFIKKDKKIKQQRKMAKAAYYRNNKKNFQSVIGKAQKIF